MSEQRISDEQLAELIEATKDGSQLKEWQGRMAVLDLRDCRAALAQAERERDEAELDISWLINNDIHNKAQPTDQLAMIRERLLTIRSRRYKP